MNNLQDYIASATTLLATFAMGAYLLLAVAESYAPPVL